MLLCVQCQTPDDGQRNCPKLVGFYSKTKFEKLVHFVGFIIGKKIYKSVFKFNQPTCSAYYLALFQHCSCNCQSSQSTRNYRYTCQYSHMVVGYVSPHMRLLVACPLIIDFHRRGIAENTTLDLYTDCKRKAIPLLAWTGPQGCRWLRLQEFLYNRHMKVTQSTGLFISLSGISELDCATTKTDTAERSISIGRESLQFFLY